uniref:Uncharacterized protein n=1 Tax=Anopheles atroparvus TaxID=41427 RepID=A0A182IXV1_ANOAO
MLRQENGDRGHDVKKVWPERRDTAKVRAGLKLSPVVPEDITITATWELTSTGSGRKECAAKRRLDRLRQSAKVLLRSTTSKQMTLGRRGADQEQRNHRDRVLDTIFGHYCHHITPLHIVVAQVGRQLQGAFQNVTVCVLDPGRTIHQYHRLSFPLDLVTQLTAQDFAATGFRDFVHKVHTPSKALLRRQLGRHQLYQFRFGNLLVRLKHDECGRQFPGQLIRNANNGRVSHLAVAEQYILELGRRNLEAVVLDQVLQPVNDEEVSFGVIVSNVAGVQPPFLIDCFACGLLVV